MLQHFVVWLTVGVIDVAVVVVAVAVGMMYPSRNLQKSSVCKSRGIHPRTEASDFSRVLVAVHKRPTIVGDCHRSMSISVSISISIAVVAVNVNVAFVFVASSSLVHIQAGR